MKNARRIGGYLLAILTMVCRMSFAQEPAANYPSRPVTIVVVVTAGGAAESEVRIYTQKLQEALGRPFVFEYRPGGGGTIGYSAVAKAAPDGYTLLATTTAFTTVPALMNLTYDPVKDFVPVILLGRQPGLLVVNPTLPVTTLQEYVSYARARPGQINWGTNGPGSTAHLVGAWLNSLTQTDVTFVHYKGGQLQTDLMGGTIQVTANALTNLAPMVKAGKLRALALAGPERSPSFPELKTAGEQGVDFEFPSWVGISAPAGTPTAIVSKLNAEFLRIQKLPETQQQLDRLGIVPSGGTPAAFGRLVAEQIDRWKGLVRQAGIRLEAP